MNILAIDTSTEILMVAAKTGEYWTGYSSNVGLKHASQLAHHINKLTNEIGIKMNQYDLIATGIGPGSFTGIRIGIATAYGIVRASNASLVGLSLIEVIAYSYRHFPGLLIPIIDARKNRYYSSFFRKGNQINEFLDVSPNDLSKLIREYNKFNEPVLLTGPAAHEFAKIVNNNWMVSDLYQGEYPAVFFEIAKLKSQMKQLTVSPLYLRKSEAEIGIVTGETNSKNKNDKVIQSKKK